MIDFDKAMLTPDSVFNTPDEVVKCQELTNEQKIKILRHWEYDARELQVAEEENMRSNQPDMLEHVLQALNKLDTKPHHGHPSPTKHGGE